MNDDHTLHTPTLCAAAVAVVSVVVSATEEQRVAAQCKRRTQWVRSRLCSLQQFGAYELLLSELLGSNVQLYAEFTRVISEDFDFLLTAIAPYVTGSSYFQKPVPPNIRLDP